MKVLPLVLLAACGASDVTVQPVVDAPARGQAAYPFDEIDSLRLSIASAGAPDNLGEKLVARGVVPVLPDVGFADNLVLHLSGLRAGIEIAYGRSCVFDVDDGASPPAPHIYFSRIVKWAPGPAPGALGRTGASAYTMPDGSAVFVGGEAGEQAVDRFDALAGRFVAAGNSAPRRGSVVAPLPDGTALRIGGATDAGPVGVLELINPARATSETIDDDALRLVEHAAATLVDGSVVVMGGRGPGTGTGLETSGATFILRLGDAGLLEAPLRLQAALAVPRAGHTATRLGEELGAAVLVVGGRDAAGAPVATAELFEPLRAAYAAFHPAMVRPRSDHRAVLMPDGSVLIVGGIDAAGAAVDTIELYLPRIGQFTAAATLPAGAGLTELSVTPLPDGRVLFAGGRDRGRTPVATTYIARLDPVDGTVDLSQTDSLAAPRAGHAAARLCDGTILVVGGTSDAAAPPSERYNPPAAGRR